MEARGTALLPRTFCRHKWGKLCDGTGIGDKNNTSRANGITVGDRGNLRIIIADNQLDAGLQSVGGKTCLRWKLRRNGQRGNDLPDVHRTKLREVVVMAAGRLAEPRNYRALLRSTGAKEVCLVVLRGCANNSAASFRSVCCDCASGHALASLSPLSRFCEHVQ